MGEAWQHSTGSDGEFTNRFGRGGRDDPIIAAMQHHRWHRQLL